MQHLLYTAACRYVCMHSLHFDPSHGRLLSLHPHRCDSSHAERRAYGKPSCPALPLHHAPLLRSMCSPHACVTCQTGYESGNSTHDPSHQLIVGPAHNVSPDAPRQRLFLKPQCPHLVVADLFTLTSSVVLLIIPPVMSTSVDGRIDAMDRIHGLPVSHPLSS